MRARVIREEEAKFDNLAVFAIVSRFVQSAWLDNEVSRIEAVGVMAEMRDLQIAVAQTEIQIFPSPGGDQGKLVQIRRESNSLRVAQVDFDVASGVSGRPS